ncbi:protein of unknown function (DUF1768) domain containing protein [Naviculisporaceae sp. PSN 640]
MPPNNSRHARVVFEDKGDRPIFFYMPKEEWGEFCQWYPAKFSVTIDEISQLVNVDDGGGLGRETAEQCDSGSIVFNCAEQFMMYCKAARFGDHATQRKILLSKDPKEQKKLGRMTSGFEDASWDEVKYNVVVVGNMAKFGQNKHLMKVLLDTIGRELAEAASKDRVWGIGFTANNARKNPSREKWGQNLLGKALMEVRERIMDGTQEGAQRQRDWEGEGRAHTFNKVAARKEMRKYGY